MSRTSAVRRPARRMAACSSAFLRPMRGALSARQEVGAGSDCCMVGGCPRARPAGAAAQVFEAKGSYGIKRPRFSQPNPHTYRHMWLGAWKVLTDGPGCHMGCVEVTTQLGVLDDQRV